MAAETKTKLTLINVEEKESKARPGETYYLFTFESEPVDGNKFTVTRAVSPHTPMLLKDIVNILWPWYGRRIGKSIILFDLDKLKGRSGEFYIHWEEYRGQQHAIVDTRTQ